MNLARRIDGIGRVFRLGSFALAMASSFGWGGLAFAQSDSSARAELEATFQKLLVKPSDRALNRKLIDLAVQLKDYDTAIGAVERLIFYTPNDAALQPEAARLYYQIKSYAASAGYVKEALTLSLTDAQRREANTLLTRVDSKTSVSIWDLYFQSGMRYQTNANVGSTLLSGNPVEPPVRDWNSFAATTLTMTNPVSKALTLEASASGYYADQLTVNRLDLGFGELIIGPRFNLPGEKLSFKPYAIGQGVLLEREIYQWAYGGGASVRYAFTEGWWLEPQVEYKLRNYFDTTTYTTATDQSGHLLTAAVNFQGAFNEHFAVSSRVSYNRNDAAADYQGYNQYAASLSLLFNFDLFGLENWSFSPYGKVIYSDYRGIAPPEVTAQSDVVRSDRQWGVGASLEIPIVDHIRIGLQAEYTKNASSLDRYNYDNLQVTSGPVVRF